MRPKHLYLLLLLLPAGCGLSGGQYPQAGDTVQPHVRQKIEWKPGSKAELWCEIRATNSSGVSRKLDHLRTTTNPVATLVFYDVEGKTIGEARDVTLNERC